MILIMNDLNKLLKVIESVLICKKVTRSRRVSLTEANDNKWSNSTFGNGQYYHRYYSDIN